MHTVRCIYYACFGSNYVSRLFVSVVTLGEIEYGHRVAHAPDPAKQAAYAKFVLDQCPVAVELTKHVAEQYGEMRAWLFNNLGPIAKRSKATRAEELVNPATGKELGIDENDIWIAAQAMTHNLVLVSHDSRGNFGKVLSQFAGSDGGRLGGVRARVRSPSLGGDQEGTCYTREPTELPPSRFSRRFFREFCRVLVAFIRPA